jgi:hypothetical protein
VQGETDQEAAVISIRLTDRPGDLLLYYPLLEFPLQATDPALDVAGCTNQIVLEGDFFQPPVSGPPQPMGPQLLALCPFNPNPYGPRSAGL